MKPNRRQNPPQAADRARAERLFEEGNRHLANGEAALAEACYRQALRLAPHLAEVHANLGLLLDQAGMPMEAEQHYRYSIACNPNFGKTHLNLGALLAQQKRFDEAEAAYRNALALMPESTAAWSNLGVLQACRKQEVEAELSYRNAIALDPHCSSAKFNLSYLLLRQGRFEEGWYCLEARNWYAALEQRLPCPRWHGEDLHGKSVLIGFEAGHGDMIQFCRYTAVLKARGAAWISMICHPALKTLFATLKDVDSLIGFDEPLPPFHWDCWTPPLSIPFHYQTRLDSIPADLPYLSAEPGKVQHWSSVLGSCGIPGDLRIGLVWKGSPGFENDADRSLPGLEVLAPLGETFGATFFSLQKGAGEENAAHPPVRLPLINLGPQIFDFADTAAIVANLDLVISVDTAVAHLAGALGKPCWVLLPEYKTDWRWLSERHDSPWYPGVMRLFRQTRISDWSTVVAELGLALRQLTANRPAR
jgi:Tfp pilus assembly protein PilF